MKKIIIAVATIAIGFGLTAFAECSCCACGKPADVQKVSASRPIEDVRKPRSVVRDGKIVKIRPPRKRVSFAAAPFVSPDGSVTNAVRTLSAEERISFLKTCLQREKVRKWQSVKKERENNGNVLKPKHLDFDFKTKEWWIVESDGTTNRVADANAKIIRFKRMLDRLGKRSKKVKPE